MALTRDEIRHLVWQEAVRQDVDPTLAVKLAYQESRFNPEARSKAGALGVMQLMPGTAGDLGVDPTDVAQNIRGGITYLKQQLTRFGGDQRLALAAYNAGPGAVQKYGDVPPYKETQHYVQTILGGQGPPQAMTALRQATPARHWGQELGFTAQAAPETRSGQAPGPDTGLPEAPGSGGTEWAQLLFGETAPAQPGSPGAGQDWAQILFG